MCGIHGFIDRFISDAAAEACIRRMIESTHHRGPDFQAHKKINHGYLGHNRLSIIDLNSVANQPMSGFGLTIVFNGEIYNYKEIREELKSSGYKFITESDTEVILAAYREWGELCVQRFTGMWAFAIYDPLNENLFCSRDRFGIKPFYYIYENGRFYFASEVKSLKNSPLFKNEPNNRQIKLFVQLSYTEYYENTLYKTVRQLEPATNLTYRDGKIELKKYWSVNYSKINLPDSQIVEKFKELFSDALRLHVRSDVPVGATLSGGLDSSSIVSAVLTQSILSYLQTFSVYYEGKDAVDERPFVHEVVSGFEPKIKATFISPEISDVRDQLAKITYHNDFPLLGSSLISQFFVMQSISGSGIKVILSGQGADDYLAGYLQSYYRYYADSLRALHFSSCFHEWKLHYKYQGLTWRDSLSVWLKTVASVLFNEKRLNSLEFKYGSPFVFRTEQYHNIYESLTSLRLDDMHSSMIFHSSLPGLLHFEDRNSMAFSIESRVPFLDHRLVEFAFSIDNSFKIRDGYTKWILRESMKGILPESVRQRKDKKGFVTPGEVRWLRHELSDLLNFDQCHIPDLDLDKVRNLIREFKNGNNKNAKLIWRIANLNYWLKSHA